MVNVGIIGKGYFGKKIYKAILPMSNIKFFTGKELDITYNVDWVVISSSTPSHYKLCKDFIMNGVNVFVEKPMTLSYNQTKELLDLAYNKGVRVYIDDVFLYHPIINQLTQINSNSIRFEWRKYGSFNDNIFNNLAYHDIYMALYLGYDLSGDIEFQVNRVNHKEFSIGNVNFYYDRTNQNKSKIVTDGDFIYDFRTNLNLISYMFRNLFDNRISFLDNNRLALQTQLVLDKLNEYKPKVAVVGAGIFGISAALKLDTDFDVTLYEINNDILKNASSINQYRLHKGYHYPRSVDTAVSAKHGTETFLNEYPCSIDTLNQHYAIASFGSKVTSDEYEKFMDDISLDYDEVELDLINTDNIDKVYKVNEGLFNPTKLYELCKVKLDSSNVNVVYNKEFRKLDELLYDYVVNSTYANLNSISDKQRNYQFELCEKPIIKLPPKYKGVGIVIMDGPFTCIDPYSDSGYHIVGNVVHAIHESNIGAYPIIPNKYKSLLNKGIVKNPSITKWELFKETLSEFFVDVDEVEHIGSMFTIRTVLADRDFDDARPSIVEKESNSKYLVFSGKISTAVDTANELYNYIMKS